MSFSSLGLSAELLRAISDQGYTEPTPIQMRAIPTVLAGRDLLAAAQTGTGKTAGFTLPLLQHLQANPARVGHDNTRQRTGGARGRSPKAARPVRALVLTPTRELAAQVADSVRTYGKHLPFTVTTIFGGVNINPQIDRLRRGVAIVVATPGRLLDHVQQRTIDLSQVEVLVLDEADRMLDMGFIPDLRRILKLLPQTRQNLLFSATFSDEIRTLAAGMLNNPETIDIAPRNATLASIEQSVYQVDKGSKRALLSWLIGSGDWQRVLIFTRTKHGANRLCDQLQIDGITADAIHGNKSQGARTRALAGFKQGRVRALVATDIAARGIDIDLLPHVVNYELPNAPEDYVHRIGRTGRAGRVGEAISLVCGEERMQLRGIERMLKRQLPRAQAEGFTPAARTEPAATARPSHGARPARTSQSRQGPSHHRPQGGRPGQRNRSGSPRSAQR